MSRIVYHGSTRRLEVFTRGGGSEKVAGFGGDYGPGMYFTTSEADAKAFGPVVGKYRIAVEKPLRIAPGKPGKAEIARLQRGLRIDDETLEFSVEEGAHPVAAMMDLMKWAASASSVRKFLEKLGYDGICVANSEIRKEHPHVKGNYWIVFDPGKIQLINPRHLRQRDAARVSCDKLALSTHQYMQGKKDIGQLHGALQEYVEEEGWGGPAMSWVKRGTKQKPVKPGVQVPKPKRSNPKVRVENKGIPYAKLQRELKSGGFPYLRSRGSHDVYESPTGKHVTIPRRSRGAQLSPHYMKQIRAAMNPKRKKKKKKQTEPEKGMGSFRDWIAVHAQMRTSAGETKGPGGKSKAQRSKEAARGKVKYEDENPYLGDAVERAKSRKAKTVKTAPASARSSRKGPPPLPASARRKSARNPKAQWTDVHKILLTRMYQRPEIGHMSERGVFALMDLQNEGLATIEYISEEYQDPKAGPEEGEVLLWDVKAKITPTGKAFVAQSGMMEESYKRQERAIRAMKAERKGRTLKVPLKNPKKKKAKKKAAKKKASKRKGPTALSLIGNCQRKWGSYCVRPSKKRLQVVLDHLEKMKASKAKSVKDERRRCLRSANLEAKRLGMK